MKELSDLQASVSNLQSVVQQVIDKLNTPPTGLDPQLLVPITGAIVSVSSNLAAALNPAPPPPVEIPPAE